MAEARRTLVKSPPELWAEISDPDTLAKHLGGFGEIRITRVEPETTVAWEGDRARGTVELEASGWGTKVRLTAETVEVAEPALQQPLAAPEVVEEEPPVVEDEPPPAAEEPPVVEDEPPPAAEEPPVVEETPTIVEEKPPVVAEEPPAAVEECPVAKAPPTATPSPAKRGRFARWFRRRELEE